MTLYKELREIINDWAEILTGIEMEMQISIKTILDEVVGNNAVFAIFFEYEYDIMNIKFFAMDNTENILYRKTDILFDQDGINYKTLFPHDLLDKQSEVINEYDGEDDNFDH
jgi:hypothetical protein